MYFRLRPIKYLNKNIKFVIRIIAILIIQRFHCSNNNAFYIPDNMLHFSIVIHLIKVIAKF